MTRKKFSLRVDFSCGVTTDECCEQAIQFAKEMNCAVVFNFNGVECHAFQGDDPKQLKLAITNALNKKTDKFLTAFARFP